MNAYRRNIYLFYAFTFFKDLFFISAVLVVFFTEWGGISLFQVMMLQAWFMFWAVILEIPTGVVADYFGRKYSLMLAGVMGAAGAFVYSITPNFYLFLLGEILFATGIALLSGADEAFIYDSLKKLRLANLDQQANKIFANAQSVKLIAITLAAIVGGVIAAYAGLPMTMWLTGVAAIVSIFIGLFFTEPKSAAKAESTRYLTILRDGYKYFIHQPVLRVIALDTAIISALAYFVIWLYQPKLQSIGIAIAVFGFFHAGLAVAQVIWLKVIPRIEHRFKHTKSLITASSILISLSFFAAGIFNHAWAVIAMFFFAGGLGLTRRTYLASYLNKKIPSAKRATVLSFDSMLRRIILIGLYPLVGYLADWSLNLTFISLGAATLLVTLFSPIKKEMFD